MPLGVVSPLAEVVGVAAARIFYVVEVAEVALLSGLGVQAAPGMVRDRARSAQRDQLI